MQSWFGHPFMDAGTDGGASQSVAANASSRAGDPHIEVTGSVFYMSFRVNGRNAEFANCLEGFWLLYTPCTVTRRRRRSERRAGLMMSRLAAREADLYTLAAKFLRKGVRLPTACINLCLVSTSMPTRLHHPVHGPLAVHALVIIKDEVPVTDQGRTGCEGGS